MRTIRVTVRGAFDGLSAEQTARLRSEQAEHDFLRTEYTAEGYLAYEVPGRPFFTVRFAEQAEDEAGVAAAAARAEAKAVAWMAEQGYPIKNVTSQAVDMSEVPLGRRGKREAARRD
ncbi:DUF6204 family protein [Actinoplanes sp. NPDC051343]|jgi:hypothetical protein|uniref:DUF6204 family protein n=1 Tax=Actinoplanes sp. NPDC051343 TaxID=3363906 RepID=UPI0037B674A1